MLSNEQFILFWKIVQEKAYELDISEPRLPRPRKIPNRFETDEESVHFPATVEAYYNGIYFEVLKLAVSTITDRFNQTGYCMYRNVEDILIKALLGEDFSNDFESVTKFYHDDLDPHRLSPQLTC